MCFHPITDRYPTSVGNQGTHVWNDSIGCLFRESRFGCPMVVCRPLSSARPGGCLVFFTTSERTSTLPIEVFENEHLSLSTLRPTVFGDLGTSDGPSFGDCVHNVDDLKKYLIRATLCALVCTLNGYQVSGQDRGPAISQFADQHSSSAVILITPFLEKFMAKPNCLLLKVSYEGVKKLAGWSGH